MCGITGILHFTGQPASELLLKKMTDAIAHRGPDGEGFYLNDGVGLGHRRLAIIDLSAAAQQPMLSPDRRYALTYNGEIYNFQELREELETLGHRFNSHTDSEVVLHAFIQWGPDCLERFNGMFAFAIWDKQQQEMFLARDRYGIKPLYYTFTSQTFLFASEQKALLAYPDVGRDVDLEAVLEYFTFQNIFTQKTLLKNIHLFPAGHYATISCQPGKQTLQFTQYWDYHFQEPERQLSETEYLEELNRLFVQAVKRQLISDVDVGAYLSGGMDSGSITAVAAQQHPFINTFTCGFDLHSVSGLELAFDERRQAEYMSYLFKTEHYEMVLKAGDMERCLKKLVYHLEEPRVGQSYPNLYAAKLASKFVKVVLSGSGGDELFAGYPWRYYRAVNNGDFEQYIDKYYLFWHRLLPNTEIQQVFAPIWNQVKHISTRDIFRNVLNKHTTIPTRPEDYVNHSLYFEAKTFLHGLLTVEDKLSMAYSLEARLPFLDNDLVDFALKIPVRFKLKNVTKVARLNENELNKATRYFQKNHDGKLLLRKAMERYIPKQITQAKKQGFSAPDASWFKGESIEYVRKTLFDTKARIYEFMAPQEVKRLIDSHLLGNENRRLLIWSLLNFESWLKVFA